MCAKMNDCGIKHTRLGCWVIGLCVTIVLAIVTTWGAVHKVQINEIRIGHGERIRQLEQDSAVAKTRFKEIQKSLKRIERLAEQHAFAPQGP